MPGNGLLARRRCREATQRIEGNDRSANQLDNTRLLLLVGDYFLQRVIWRSLKYSDSMCYERARKLRVRVGF